MSDDEQKIEEARALGITMGDSVEVEFEGGGTMIGTFSLHSIAGYCVKNQHGFPFQYSRLIRRL